jgi:hypothetical protein
MADGALQASEAADAERSVAPVRDVPALAASSNQSVHWAEPASAAAPYRQASVRFAGRSCVAAEPLAQQASQALPLQAAWAALAAQPEELPLELSSPPVALQAEVVLLGEQAALAQQSSPRVWLPELQA